MRIQSLIQVAAGAALLTSANVMATEPFFMGLGSLPDGLRTRTAILSRDGGALLVTGNPPISSPIHYFHWTAATGLVRLPDPPPGNISAAFISADGSVVVRGGSGIARISDTEWIEVLGPFSWQPRALSADGSTLITHGNERWTQAGVMDLGAFPDQTSNGSYDLSDDGSVIVGWSDGFGGSAERAYRWTPETGKILIADNLLSRTAATSVSADGSVIVGNFLAPDGRIPFRWTAETGALLIEPQLLTNAFFPDPSAGPYVSDDGRVVFAGNNRWTLETEWKELDFTSAVTSGAISADGTVAASYAGPSATREVAVWDETHGVRRLRDILADDYGLGPSLAGWGRLALLGGLSADGRTISGVGFNPAGVVEAWIAHLGSSTDPRLPGDANGDGIVDRVDFAIAVTYHGTESGASFTSGDFDGDGRVSLTDAMILQSHFGESRVAASAAASVPEPTTCSLVVIALLGVCLAKAHAMRPCGQNE